MGLGYVEQEEYGIVKKIGGAVHINNFALAEKYHGVVQTYTEQGIRINLSDILLDECMQKIEKIRKLYKKRSFSLDKEVLTSTFSNL